MPPVSTVGLAAFPLVVTLSEDPGEPIKLRAKHKVAGMLLLYRDQVKRLDPSWNVPGAYILLDRTDSEGQWGAYVGKATNPGLRQRVQQQLKDRDHWYRALLIRYESNDDEKLNSAEAGWLETEIYHCLDSAETVDLHNRNRPQDSTLPIEEEASLRDYMIPIESALNLIGHTLRYRDPYAPDSGPLINRITSAPAPEPPRSFVSVLGLGTNPPIEAIMEKLAQVIGDRHPRIGHKPSGTRT